MPVLIPLTVPEVRRRLLALDDPPERRQAAAAPPALVHTGVWPVHSGDEEPSPLPAELTDSQWRQLAPLLPAQRRRQGQPLRALRQMINAMLWIERTDCSWRALPNRFGPWHDVYARYHRWRQDGLWLRIRQALQPVTSQAVCA